MKVRGCLVLCFVMMPLMQSWASEDRKAGVLEIEVRSGGSWGQKVANTATREVRSLIRGQRQWRCVGKLSATLTDAKEGFGCSETNETCMRELAETLGLDVLIWGIVERSKKKVKIRLWGVSVDQRAAKMETVFTRRTSKKQFRGLIKKMLDQLMGSAEKVTQVSIQTEPVGASVLINGESVGSTPITMALREGSYGVEVRADGFVTLKRDLRVKQSAVQTERWLLSPTSETSAMQTSSYQTRDIMRWTSLGVSLAALATTAYVHSQGVLLHGDVVDRLQCKNNVYLNPDECGTSIPDITAAEHSQLQSRYKNYQYLLISGYVLTGLSAAVFGSTFFF